LVARNEARQAIEASSLSLVANARQALSDKDTTSALLLALAANRIEQPPIEAQRVLLDAAFSPGPRDLFAVTEIFESVEGPPLSVAVSPDGRTALTGLFDGNIALWNIETRTEIRRFVGHAPGEFDSSRISAYSGVNDIAFSPDGTMAISGGDDGVVILWDVSTGEEIRRFKGHSGAVRAVAISPDGLMAISGGFTGESHNEPGELILWDMKTGQEIRRLDGNVEAVIDISLSPDGRRVIASSGEIDYIEKPFQSYSLILWDVETGEIVHNFEGIERVIPAVAISPVCTPVLSENGGNPTETADEWCSSHALTGSTDHNLYLWDLETGEPIRTFEGHTDLIRVVAFSPDGQRVLSGGDDGEVILWNLEEGEILARFDAHDSGVNDIAFSPDGRTAFSIATDGSTIQWDLFNEAQINRFEGHDAAVLDVAYTPNGKHFLSASGPFNPAAPIIEEESMRLWNLESGEQTGSLDWYLSDVFQVAISPDGRRALSGLMVDQSVRLWDLATGREIRRFEGHMMPVLSVAFTPDGRMGLSGAVDSIIILWDLETGEEIRRLIGHEGGIWALAVSPDGRTALSGADDREVIWWNLETGEEIHRFSGHNETVSGVAFSPDGQRAISGDTEGPLIEWDLEMGEEIQRFSGHGGTGPVGRTRVAYNPDGDIVLSSGWDGTLALWDLQTGRELHRFRGHDTDFIFDVAISPDGQTALSCGTDQTIIQWQLDIPSLEELIDWITANRYVRDLSCYERDLYQIEPLCTP
jgi:WD40 repeat protein